MLRHDRLQHACAHLDGLLHEIVEPPDLERREEIVQVRSLRLRPGLLDRFQQDLLLRGIAQRHQPFAVAAVEHRHLVAGGQAHHRGQVAALPLVEVQPGAGHQIVRNEQTDHGP